MNKYGVTLTGPGGVPSRPKLSGPKLLCQLKDKVEVATLTSDMQPFSALPWATQLPLKQLTSDIGPYKSCAVVSSAGSLRNSGLGKEIGEKLLHWCFKNKCLTDEKKKKFCFYWVCVLCYYCFIREPFEDLKWMCFDQSVKHLDCTFYIWRSLSRAGKQNDWQACNVLEICFMSELSSYKQSKMIQHWELQKSDNGIKKMHCNLKSCISCCAKDYNVAIEWILQGLI